MPAPLMSEADRLASLLDLNVLDSSTESVFDGLVAVAAYVCGVPISLISLIDADRQWFKANIGLTGVSETPRELAFCAHAIEQGGIMEIQDALSDPRFAQNPLVTGDPNIRFYAGANLELSDGAHAGTLCVIDRKPRELSNDQKDMLEHLARAAVRLLESKRLTTQLAISESRFRALCDASPMGIFGAGPDGGCTYTNARLQEIFGITKTDALGYGWSSALHPDDRDTVFEEWNRTAANRNDFDMEFRVNRKTYPVIYARAVSRPVFDNEGTPSGHVGMVEDISERIQQRIELAEQHELLRVTLSSIAEAVITTDASNVVTWLNPIAEKMTGWTLASAIDKPLCQVFNVPKEQTSTASSSPTTVSLAQSETLDVVSHKVLRSISGQEYGIEDSTAPITNQSGDILGNVLVFRDVTEQRRLTSEMNHRATHDSLTGLINRSEFECKLQGALNNAHENNVTHALIYIDLDRFKLVNDSCGHSIGDLLLKQVSKLMLECIRSSDTLARIGGDEFGAILENCNPEQAQRVAQLICQRVDDYRFTHADRLFRIGASIGLVPVDKRWSSLADVLQAADGSCYAAKEAGRNRVNLWTDTEQHVRLRNEELQWATRLQQALDENLFVLYAQRIKNLNNDACGIHAEVLLRLRSPDGKIISPNMFLPAAERFHLATSIDIWVLRNAIHHLSNLTDLSTIEMLCINLSGQSVGDKDFHGTAIRLLDDAGSEICHRICLEITETAAVTNITDATIFINHSRKLGVRIALDDFGAGASSFSYLKTLNVDILKIDGQFITGMLDDQLDDAAVRCFVDVARITGLQTVAEFVKSEDILQHSHELGIDYAQGFLIHEPQTIDQVVI